MTRPLLALVAILKNEERSVAALLDSVKGVVDRVTILDTGSTDATWAILASRLATPEGQHLIVQEPFVPYRPLLAATPSRHVIDFAATRNRVLELEETREYPSVFCLMLSGDEVLHNGAELRAFLETQRDTTTDAFCITMMKDSSSWPFPRVLRTGGGRRYQFPIHETPVGKNGETGGPLVPGVFIKYDAPDQERMRKRLKEVDLPLLEFIAAQPVVTHEDHAARARALLFLAQTHENIALEYDAKDPGMPWLTHQYAAMSYYWRRAELAGDPVDANYSLLHYYDIASRVGHIYTHAEFISRLVVLATMDPDRPEVRYKIAMHASQVDMRQAVHYAMEAAKVAKAAKGKTLPFSTDSRIEWLSLQIAAEASQKLKMTAQAKKCAQDGIAAGGPKEAFEEYLS
jgi:glycosyltransferase involved in cell wall biosynthesis